MSIRQEQKKKYRKNKWTNRICITKAAYKYIKKIMEQKEYNTLAGTLDYIINAHRNGQKKKDIQ